MRRDTAVLYSSATCQLDCTYCYINKNKALSKIDKLIDESFKNPNYYFNFIKEYFDIGDLKNLEVWGAETFHHMDRVYPVLRQIIGYYPFFRRFFASTNFVYPEWVDCVYNTLNQFSSYAPRVFDVTLQLSIDGPSPINDLTRGKGTTEKCLKNLDLFLSRYQEIPDNVNLTLSFKPTLSTDTIYLLDTKDRIIGYYRFFEELINKILNDSKNITAPLPIPNMAVPSLATKEDGIYFANLVKTCREIEKIPHVFDHYKVITPFNTSNQPKNRHTYKYPCFTCGSGSTNVGFLPNNLISSCHNGFVDTLSDYEKFFIQNPNSVIDNKLFRFINNRFTHTKENYPKYERQVQFFNDADSMFRMGCLAGYIRTLALAGEIDEKYKTEEGAIIGAEKYQFATCNCLRDNYMVTGSITLQPEGMIRLLLNGAIDYIMEGDSYECN